jgi:N-methylhydantoinase B
MGAYFQPASLSEAVEMMAAQVLTVIAGGTDIYPAQANAQARGEHEEIDLVDISGIPGLDQILIFDDHVVLGPAVTWTQLSEAELPAELNALREASRQVGGRQVQNRGTIAGNICNASPAADGVPSLLALSAELELSSKRGRRRLAISDFVLGNRRTAIRSDELVSAIHIPRMKDTTLSAFEKLGARAYLVISIAMVSVHVSIANNRTITDARFAVGACSEVARRLDGLETQVIGYVLNASIAKMISPEHFADLAPIDDVRASAGYRRLAAASLLRRALTRLIVAS